jgi:hypothetical protein
VPDLVPAVLDGLGQAAMMCPGASIRIEQPSMKQIFWDVLVEAGERT